MYGSVNRSTVHIDHSDHVALLRRSGDSRARPTRATPWLTAPNMVALALALAASAAPPTTRQRSPRRGSASGPCPRSAASVRQRARHPRSHNRAARSLPTPLARARAPPRTGSRPPRPSSSPRGQRRSSRAARSLPTPLARARAPPRTGSRPPRPSSSPMRTASCPTTARSSSATATRRLPHGRAA